MAAGTAINSGAHHMSQDTQEGHVVQSGMNMYQSGGPTLLQGANNNGQVLNMDPNALAAAMMQQQQQQQQQQPQQQQQQQQYPVEPKVDQEGVSISNEIKRLQQLQQMSAGANGNALLLPAGGAPAASGDNPATLFQSVMGDQQKIPNPRMDNPLAQNMGVNPMLQPAFLQDARLLLAQNPINPANMNPALRTGQPGELPLPSPHSLFHRDGSRRMRGGVIEPFPEKLHRLLMEVEAAGRSDVISFVANGKAFAIHKPDKFFKEIVPLYFRQSRLSSFKRQLNLYGFELINTGPARGGYYHELFVKDHPESSRRMRRVAVKVSSKNERGGGDETKSSLPPADIFGEESHEEKIVATTTTAGDDAAIIATSGEQGTGVVGGGDEDQFVPASGAD